MLYVSRLVGYTHLGVVDTKTGREEIYDRETIANAITKRNTFIEGATVEKRFGVYDVASVPIPYQLPETVTPLQVKMNMVGGIDIRVYNGIISRFLIRTEEIKTPVRVRLSDFGDSVADYVLFGNQAAYNQVMEVILDDKIKSVTSKSFRVDVGVLSAASLGVVFDLRELSDDSIAENIYCALAADYCKPSVAITDNLERMAHMMALYGGEDD